MKKMNKKGFTIVELVIVIAVIAILAAVLIPTFSSVVNSANASAAQQQAKAGLDSILALTNGSLPEHTLFSVSNNDQNTASYWFEYSKNKLNSVKIDSNDNFYYEQTGSDASSKTTTYAVYVSAACFDASSEGAAKAIEHTSALILDTLKRAGVFNANDAKLCIKDESVESETSLHVGSETSLYKEWSKFPVAKPTGDYLEAYLCKTENTENTENTYSQIGGIAIRIYYTSDIQDTMVVFIGHNK